MKRQHIISYALAAACVAITKALLTTQSATAPLSALVHFESIRPQQLRLLTFPLLWLLNLLGISLISAEALIDAFACFGYLLFLSRALSHLAPAINKYATLLAVIPLIVNYGVLGYVGYPSDIPSLFLFTAAAYYILTEQFRMLTLGGFCAALNRETAIFIFVLFVGVHWRRIPWKQAGVLAAAIAIPLVALRIVFQSYPGAVSEDHLGWNMSLLRQAFTLHRPGIVYALTLFSGFHIFVLAFLAKSPAFVRSLYVCSILIVAALVPVAILTEARVYNEANLGFTLPVIYGLFAMRRAAAKAIRKFV